MLTEVETERRDFEQQTRLRQHLSADVTASARRDVIGQHRHKFRDAAAQDRFARLLERCEKDADAIACEAAEQAGRTGPGPTAQEAAYIEAYADALPALVATALARADLTDPA